MVLRPELSSPRAPQSRSRSSTELGEMSASQRSLSITMSGQRHDLVHDLRRPHPAGQRRCAVAGYRGKQPMHPRRAASAPSGHCIAGTNDSVCHPRTSGQQLMALLDDPTCQRSRHCPIVLFTLWLARLAISRCIPRSASSSAAVLRDDGRAPIMSAYPPTFHTRKRKSRTVIMVRSGIPGGASLNP